MINVTKTYLPSKDKLKSYIDIIYDIGKVTNNGQFVQLLQKKLESYLGVRHVLLVSNGTLALQVAYKLLNLKGEVITTPFSFVATTSSLVWENLKPVFVDINPETFCIDYKKINSNISPNTSAILPVHVFGNGCDVEDIEKIANRYNLKVIYDAAHAFGVKYKNESILNYGDISVLSFHATKIFHTIEGGALIINDDDLYERALRTINFGITGPENISGIGINAKMNEFQAAMGLCVLDEIDQATEKRKIVYDYYVSNLERNDGITMQKYNKNCNNNYGYFPILLKNEDTLLNIKNELEYNDIFPRRYFYPSLDTLDYIQSDYMEYSNNISKRILCLPISSYLSSNDVMRIISIINNVI